MQHMTRDVRVVDTTRRNSEEPPRRKQFSLRLLLLVVLFLGPVCGWFGPPIIRLLVDFATVDEVDAVRQIRTHGGTI